MSVWVGLNNRSEERLFLYGSVLTTVLRERVSVWVGLNNRGEGQVFSMGRP